MHRRATFSRKHARRVERRASRKLAHALRELARAIRNLLCEIRRIRFANGVQCPHCRSRKFQKWGKFSGRQRYYCKSCQRTFSDLTHTAAAYTKRLTSWLAYAECMIEGLSIRRSAARVGINPSTSFRWRHALLKAIGTDDCTRLENWIQIQETQFLYSEKGNRHLRRSARRRGHAHDIRPFLFDHIVSALFACDENRSVLSGVALARRPRTSDLCDLLHMRTCAGAALIAKGGSFSVYATAAHQLRLHYKPVTSADRTLPTHPLANARDYIGRFRAWLERFRGVATKYLPNYLAWHRALDARSQDDAVRRTRWPIGMHPTLPIIAWFPES